MRCLEILVSLAGLILLSPMLAVVSIALKLTSSGPVFFTPIRLGQHGRRFKLYKFRTMVDGSESTGPAVTSSADMRVTKLGRILRLAKLDEIPQLLNVLFGQMSLVGPRPEDPKFLPYYDSKERGVLDVKPGITSVASIKYRHESQFLGEEATEEIYIQRILPAKLRMELEYLANRSLLSDCGVLFKTFLCLFRRI